MISSSPIESYPVWWLKFCTTWDWCLRSILSVIHPISPQQFIGNLQKMPPPQEIRSLSGTSSPLMFQNIPEDGNTMTFIWPPKMIANSLALGGAAGHWNSLSTDIINASSLEGPSLPSPGDTSLRAAADMKFSGPRSDGKPSRKMASSAMCGTVNGSEIRLTNPPGMYVTLWILE